MDHALRESALVSGPYVRAMIGFLTILAASALSFASAMTTWIAVIFQVAERPHFRASVARVRRGRI